VKGLFVDTSAWYPLANDRHPDHRAFARRLRAGVRRGARIVTTNIVVAEAHALLIGRAGLHAASAFLKAVREAPTQVEYITPEREEAAIGNWIERFSDQPFSLADAASFVVMAELGIREALTLDHHFMTAGFITLPARC